MNDELIVYNFATQYTRYPGGRLKKHGPYSGEAFREDVLWPLLQGKAKVHVDLSNTYGFGSSFLDESFGEIGKRLGLLVCKQKLEFSSTDDPSLVDLVWAKINKASVS
jgi:hypothetical protein